MLSSVNSANPMSNISAIQRFSAVNAFKNATVTLIDNPNIAYIRVCSYGNNGTSIPDGAANSIITVNEEIT